MVGILKHFKKLWQDLIYNTNITHFSMHGVKFAKIDFNTLDFHMYCSRTIELGSTCSNYRTKRLLMIIMICLHKGNKMWGNTYMRISMEEIL